MLNLAILALGALAIAKRDQSASINNKYIQVTANESSAGAITSLLWWGREFVDSRDHGRLLQSAFSFDGLGEAFNPTEAGSELDGRMPGPSSSRLLSYDIGPNWFSTDVQAAYWRPVRGQTLSNHRIRKTVTLGYGGIPTAIEYKISFVLAPNELHTRAVFEFLTGYMPVLFSKFYSINTNTGGLMPLSDGPGEMPCPVVFSTPTGSAAMGVWCPAGTPGGGYGRWRMNDCVKWNVVTRVASPVPGMAYDCRILLCVGTLAQTMAGLTSLYLAGE